MSGVYGVDYGHGVPLMRPRRDPRTHTVSVSPSEFVKAISGACELRAPASEADEVERRDVVHLVDRTTGRCCMRVVTARKGRGTSTAQLTVIPGRGACTSC